MKKRSLFLASMLLSATTMLSSVAYVPATVYAKEKEAVSAETKEEIDDDEDEDDDDKAESKKNKGNKESVDVKNKSEKNKSKDKVTKDPYTLGDDEDDDKDDREDADEEDEEDGREDREKASKKDKVSNKQNKKEEKDKKDPYAPAEDDEDDDKDDVEDEDGDDKDEVDDKDDEDDDDDKEHSKVSKDPYAPIRENKDAEIKVNVKPITSAVNKKETTVVTGTLDSATQVSKKLDKVDDLKVKSATKKKVVIKWDKVDNASSYEVYRREEGTEVWKLVKTTTKTSYTDKQMAKGVSYEYHVVACASDGTQSEIGEVVEAATKGKKAQKPTLKVTKSDDSAKLTWDESKISTDKVAVYMKTGKGKWKKAAIVDAEKGSYTKELEAGKKYTFRIAGYTEDGDKEVVGTYSSAVKVKIKK